MRDLRKKILLESGKTMSRKARSRPASNFGSAPHSPASSPAQSRAGSRAPSRLASDDDLLSDSDINDSVTNSVADTEEGEDGFSDWTDKLKDCINEILDRKRSSTRGREAYLAGYVHLTRHHFADTMVEGSLHDLVPAMLKSIRGGRNTEEIVAALKGLMMTILSVQDDVFYDQVFSTLKATCENSEEEAVKVQAINTMAVVAVFGGGLQTAIEELMDFLLETIESDGHSIDAGDNGPVVTAALITWGFLASYVDDLEQQSEPALEAFMEQLDSTDVDVQVAAGTNVALIFEAVRNYNERMREEHEERQEEAREEARRQHQEFRSEPYNPFDLQYNQHKLVQRMMELAGESSKGVSKKDRRQLHSQFASILTSLELGKGPGYSTAGRIARESDRGGARVYDSERVFEEFGYRETVRDKNMSMTIDSWSLSIRVGFLKKLLGGGFPVHWSENPAVRECFETA